MNENLSLEIWKRRSRLGSWTDIARATGLTVPAAKVLHREVMAQELSATHEYRNEQIVRLTESLARQYKDLQSLVALFENTGDEDFDEDDVDDKRRRGSPFTKLNIAKAINEKQKLINETEKNLMNVAGTAAPKKVLTLNEETMRKLMSFKGEGDALDSLGKTFAITQQSDQIVEMGSPILNELPVLETSDTDANTPTFERFANLFIGQSQHTHDDDPFEDEDDDSEV
jgi:hypothetical protein